MAILSRRRSQIPGSRFNPLDLEIINYLRRRIERNKKSSYITDLDVYEKEPWLLQHVRHPKFKKNVWFYFVTRKKSPRVKKFDSTRTSRVIGSGRWKTTGALIDLIDTENIVKVGTKQSINFKAKIGGKKDEINTGWVMHEFLLDKPGFHEVALCRIQFKPDKNNAHYAPRLEPIVIGDAALVPQQQPHEEDSLVKIKEHTDQEDFKKLMSLSDFEGSGQGMDLPQLSMKFQETWFGSCSGETSQQFMGQYSSYLMNGGIEQQHQDFGSCSQQQNQILGHFSPIEPQQHYGQGFGDLTHANPNQYLGQDKDPWQFPMMNQAMNENGYFGPYLAQPYLGQDMAPMTQGMMVRQQEQYSAAQYQNFSISGDMEQHQNYGSCSQFVEESLGQQQNQILGQQGTQPYLGQDMASMMHGMMVPQQEQCFSAQYQKLPVNGGMKQHRDFGSCGQFVGESSGQQQNQFLERQGMMDPQDFGFSSICLAQNNQNLGQTNDLSVVPMDTQQGIMEHQYFGSSSLCLAQTNQNVGQNNDSSMVPMETQQNMEPQQQDNSYFEPNVLGDPAAQQQNLGQDSNLSLNQQQNQILEYQNYSQVVPDSVQPYSGQNIDLPTLTMETQHQDNIVETSPTQLQLETNQEMFLQVDQRINEPREGICGSSTLDKLFQQSLDDETFCTNEELDIMMANFGNEEWAQQLGVNTPEEEAELKASLGQCNSYESLLDYFSST